MRSWYPWLLIVTIAACSGNEKDEPIDDDVPVDGDADTDADADSDTDTDTDSDTDVGCTATITGVTPEDNNFLVPLNTAVTVSFSEAITADDPFDIQVSGVPGTPTLAGDGLSATWAGTLDFETSYTINASVCADSFESNFRTLPEPVDALTFEGNTYSLPWGDLNITEPTNDVALNEFIDVDYILAQIIGVSGATADAVATVGYDDATLGIIPDCAVATEQAADFTYNPYFSIVGDIQLVINPTTGQTVTVEAFSLLARMAPDGQSITDVSLTGLVATESIIAGEDCNSLLVALLGPTCLPCTSSATGQCLLFEADAASAPFYDLDLNAECFPPPV